MKDKFTKVQEAARFIESNLEIIAPKTCIVLGTGLDGLADIIEKPTIIDYGKIPYFPQSTVKSHRGHLIAGHLHGKPILLMAGRFHYYEGYSAAEISFPVYVLKQLGIEKYLASNVTGGINPDYEAGEIVLIRDHINLHPDHPLRGENDDRLGPRFPDMMEAYDREINTQIQALGKLEGYSIQEGVYVGLQGPSLETPAEYKFCRIIGGDMIGMSTVPEIIAGNHCGLRCAVVSIISNVCYPLERLSKTTLEEVIQVAEEASPRLRRIIEQWVKLYA